MYVIYKVCKFKFTKQIIKLKTGKPKLFHKITTQRCSLAIAAITYNIVCL